MKRVYFDNSATTKVRKEVIESMLPCFTEFYGNPASLHLDGQQALKAVDESREKIKDILKANSLREIIFTSSATESNNLAIKGLVFNFYKFFKPHIITSSIEHPSILEILEDLLRLDLVEATFIKSDKNGIINPEEIKKNIKENTLLVTLHYVNSESGVVQKIQEIGEILQEINKNIRGRIYFHTDAAQVSVENLNLQESKVDMMTLSSHKIYGPKGIALLYVKENTPLMRIISGSNEEYGLRGGTLNVPLIVGFAKALELLYQERDYLKKHLNDLRNYFLEKMKELNDEMILNFSPEICSPKIISLYFPHKESQEVLFYLDQKGIAISQGTACQSRSAEPSYVVAEIYGKERAKRSIRISFGRENTKEEIDYFFEVLKNWFKIK